MAKGDRETVVTGGVLPAAWSQFVLLKLDAALPDAVIAIGKRKGVCIVALYAFIFQDEVITVFGQAFVYLGNISFYSVLEIKGQIST